MHEDMGEFVRTGERTGYGVNAVFVLICNVHWSRDMLHNSAPDMAVYVFEHLSLIEVKQILIDDPELAGLDNQARISWDTTVRIYLPKCAIWRRDFDGLKENVQTVHLLYISLGYQYSDFTESQRRRKLSELFMERLKSCKPELRPNRFSIESAKQPTLEEVVQRGMDCILLLLALHVAAWNSIGADRVVMYNASTGRTKKDPKGVAAYKKAQHVLDRMGRGPQAVTRSRLFEYMLHFCRQIGHRMHELAPDVDVDMMRYMLEDQEEAPQVRHDLAPRERLEEDSNIQRDLQWCVQRRLIVEEQQEDNTMYHMWLREYLAIALFQHLQSQGKLDREDDLKNYVVYLKR
ncbi:hypothetical protein ABBQ32_010857 [Trebouxia sp. C0010 RCD-2024]